MLFTTYPIIGETIEGYSMVNLILGCFFTILVMGTFIFLLYRYTSKSVKVIKTGGIDEKIIEQKGKLKNRFLGILGIIIGWLLLIFLILVSFLAIYVVYLDDNHSVTLGTLTVGIEKLSTGFVITENSLPLLTKNPVFFGASIEFLASIIGMLMIVCIGIYGFLMTASYLDIKKAMMQRYKACVALDIENKKQEAKEELSKIKLETESIDTHKSVDESTVSKQEDLTEEKVIHNDPVNEDKSLQKTNNQFNINPKYNISHFGKLAIAETEVQQRYSDLKNEILKYAQVSNLKSWKCEKFNYHKEKLIKICVKGKTIVAYFNIDKKLLVDSNIRYEEFKPTRETEDYTVRIKLTNSLKTKHAITLADLLLINRGISLKRNYVKENYVVPRLTAEECVKKGLAKQNY